MRETEEKIEEKGKGDRKAGWRKRERKHLTQPSLARRKGNGFKKLWKKGAEKETTFLGLLCLSPLCRFLSQLRTTHHNCTVFPPDPSIHPKGEPRRFLFQRDTVNSRDGCPGISFQPHQEIPPNQLLHFPPIKSMEFPFIKLFPHRGCRL